MSKKMLFVFNPHSGKAQIKNHLCDILDIFTKGGYDVTVHPTQAPLDAYETIKSTANNYDIVAISGGDGTLNEAVRGMMTFPPDLRCHIGYIPAGTVNDFASNLGIPKNMLDAAKTIVDGCEVKCDIGQFNGRSFNYVAAFGAFTDVSYNTPQSAKNLFGHTAYFVEGVKRLTNIETTHVKLTYDNNFIEGNYLVGLVLNSTHVAGLELNEYYNVNLNDGIFEIALIELPENIMQIGSIINTVKNGGTEGIGFKVVHASNMHFEMDTDVKWTLDGEFGGEFKSANIAVNQSAVSFISSKNHLTVGKRL